MPKNNIIGVFDSGLGGLTVLNELLKIIPNYHYIYLGDNARVPYGNKSRELIYEYTRQAVDFLFQKGAHLIIIACNTASAEALRTIQQNYLPKRWPGRRVLGVIRPVAEFAAQTKGINKIGIIGTKATIASQTYPIEIHKLNPKIIVQQTSAPLLVPIVEEGWEKKAEAKSILKQYLLPLKKKSVQALILGCTHYPFLINETKKIMGPKCLVPHPGNIVAKSLKNYLERHPELDITPRQSPQLTFYTTDQPTQFKKLGEKFLKRKIKDIQQINLI